MPSHHELFNKKQRHSRGTRSDEEKEEGECYEKGRTTKVRKDEAINIEETDEIKNKAGAAKDAANLRHSTRNKEGYLREDKERRGKLIPTRISGMTNRVRHDSAGRNQMRL